MKGLETMTSNVIAKYTGSICDNAYACYQGLPPEDMTDDEITLWDRGLQGFIAAGSDDTRAYDVMVSLDGEMTDSGPEPYFGNHCIWCDDECQAGDRYDATVTVFG